MDNIDAIIYSKYFIKELDSSTDFFDEDQNPFIDKELLYEEILKVSTKNTLEFNEPKLTEEQFIASVDNVRLAVITKTLQDLVEKGMVDITAMNPDGEFLYSINQEYKKILNKNHPKT